MIVVTCSLIHSHNIVSAAETSLVLVNLKCFEHYYLTALMTPETDKQLISDLRAQGPGGASLIRLPDCLTAHPLLIFGLFSGQFLHSWPVSVFHPPNLFFSMELWDYH